VAQLAELGVNRLVISLPTLGEADTLRYLDEQVKVVEWARRVGA